MSIGLKEYRENARKNDLCSEYSQKWDECKSYKQVIDMALDVKGVDYLCDTISKGWGITYDVILDKFGNFINGKYISHQDGYTSKMYCDYEGDVETNTTLICLISSNIVLSLLPNSLCEVYVTGKCNIEVKGDGRCVFVCYGNEKDISITGNTALCKRINKKDRDRYE